MAVEFRSPKPHALMWTGVETTGVPTRERPNDFSTVYPLEVCVIFTDFDLEPFGGYAAVITPTAESVAALRENPDVLEMHRTSGLIAALKGESVTIEQAERDIIDVIKKRTTYEHGEFMIAGSGVAAFDYPLIKHWMPSVARYMAYYPFDIGVMRRTARILSGGRQLVDMNAASYGDAKLHRAQADTEAHISEAKQWQEFFRRVS